MRAARRGLVTAGILAMGYAIVGALTDPGLHVGGVLIFLAAVLAAHDIVLLPLIIGFGALIARLVPAGARIAIRVAALCTAAVMVVTLPLVLGYGKSTDNPSALPLAYGRGLATVLTLIWTVALASILGRRVARYRRIRTAARTAEQETPRPDGQRLGGGCGRGHCPDRPG
jgi:hypothetical protein